MDKRSSLAALKYLTPLACSNLRPHAGVYS